MMRWCTRHLEKEGENNKISFMIRIYKLPKRQNDYAGSLEPVVTAVVTLLRVTSITNTKTDFDTKVTFIQWNSIQVVSPLPMLEKYAHQILSESSE
jgi:hypothetical protein